MIDLENITKSGRQFTLKHQEKIAYNEILDDKIYDEFNGKEKQWEQFKTLTYRGVNNVSLISRTIGIHRNTIAKWKKKLIKYHKELAMELDYESEFMKMIEQCDLIIKNIWTEIDKGNLSGRQRIDAVVKIMTPLRMKAEMMGFLNGDMMRSLNAAKPVVYELDKEVCDHYTRILNQYDKEDRAKIMEDVTGIKPI